MAKNKVITQLVCTECKMRNYTQRLTKTRTIGSLNIKKFCAKCRKHHLHKETK
ncbi:50S ribosomal protein L33 [Candidatus Dependentiae bacterium]|nr:MAG: 50S ribosomal protein L33 [Candidatus Dependentiae bacterium]